MDSKVLAYAQKCAHPKWYLYLLHFLVATTVFAPCFALWGLFTSSKLNARRTRYVWDGRFTCRVLRQKWSMMHELFRFRLLTFLAIESRRWEFILLWKSSKSTSGSKSAGTWQKQTHQNETEWKKGNSFLPSMFTFNAFEPGQLASTGNGAVRSSLGKFEHWSILCTILLETKPERQGTFPFKQSSTAKVFMLLSHNEQSIRASGFSLRSFDILYRAPL